MVSKKPKLGTLKDLEYHNVDIVCGDTIAKRTSCCKSEDLRLLIIKWIKKDIRDSIDDFLYTKAGKIWLEKKMICREEQLPNRKFCRCDPEYSCNFHREGIRLMKIFNIKEKDVK